MKTVDKIYIRSQATFLNLQLWFQPNAESWCLAIQAKETKTITCSGKSELPSDEKHRRELWGQKGATYR